MIPILFEPTATQFDSFGIGHLTDAISPHVVEERNGEFTFQMNYPIDGAHYDEIVMRSIILAKPNPQQNPQPFRVYRITKPINGIFSVYANHIRYDLAGVPVAPFTATSISDALTKMVSNRLVSSPFTFDTDKTSGTDMVNKVPTSTQLLMGGQQGSLLDLYGGEYLFDGYNITLLKNRGANTGVVIRYGVDLIDMVQEENCASCYTGVLCYWQSIDGETIVTGNIQSAGTFDYTKVLVVDKSDSYEEAPTQARLDADANAYINTNKVGVPKVSLSVEFANLEQTEEYKNIRQSIALCDYITVEFEKIGVSALAKVIRTDYDVILERYISVDIGDTRASLADTVVGLSATVENVPSTTEMQQAITAMTAAITGAKGGAVRLLDTNNDGQPDTLYIADNADPLLATKIWRFNYEGWGASTNGYNGPFTLGATLDNGLLADFIKAGTLDASQITVQHLSANAIDSGTINAENINVTNINGQNIKAGTIGSDPLASNAVTSVKINSGAVTESKIGSSAVTNSKLGSSSVSEAKIGTDAVVNRCIASGSIYPTTCNSTINGYFADVIEFNQLRAGSLIVSYLSAGVVSWDKFRLANGGTQYVMYRDANTGALYAHT